MAQAPIPFQSMRPSARGKLQDFRQFLGRTIDKNEAQKARLTELKSLKSIAQAYGISRAAAESLSYDDINAFVKRMEVERANETMREQQAVRQAQMAQAQANRLMALEAGQRAQAQFAQRQQDRQTQLGEKADREQFFDLVFPKPGPTEFGGPQPAGSPPRISVIDKVKGRPEGPGSFAERAALLPREAQKLAYTEQVRREAAKQAAAGTNLDLFFKSQDELRKQAGEERDVKAALAKPANDLRNDFLGLPSIRDFNKVHAAYKKVEEAATRNTAADDIALIFNYMKILDPGSTVREGEFATAETAGGIDTRVVNIYNKLKRGTRLTGDQRIDFLNSAKATAQAQFDELSGYVDWYADIAGKKGIPVDEVIPTDFLEIRRKGLGYAPAPTGLQATPPGQTAPVPVTVVRVLPSGNRLVKAEDGTFFELPPEPGATGTPAVAPAPAPVPPGASIKPTPAGQGLQGSPPVALGGWQYVPSPDGNQTGSPIKPAHPEE